MIVFQQLLSGFRGIVSVSRLRDTAVFPPLAFADTGRNHGGKSFLFAAFLIIGFSALSTMSHADGLEGMGILLDSGYSYDNNLTHASDPADKRSDSALNLNLSGNKAVALSEHTRLVLNGFIDTEAFATYGGLDRLSANAEAEYMYRPSGEFAAPTFGFVTDVGRDEFRSDLRKNDHYSAGITLRQPVTDRVNLYAALKDNISHSDNAVFSTRDGSAQLHLDYGYSNGNTLYLTGEYRIGDTVSTVFPTLSYREIAAALINDDVFTTGQPMRDYRFNGKAGVVALGYNLALEGRKSLDISWHYTRSTADSSAIKYVGSQFSVDYLMGF
ncbi:MAG TPA: hypothetical protein VK832_19170 [Burkholderiaceae bacterium]|jgi:hypothetical protein|nr:hypothetical protein [Burkholderiaceae bacterium]